MSNVRPQNMAGTRHHIVPRFLLRGFASHKVGDETYAWVYRAGREPFNTNITNIAVEGHFYTHKNRSNVDDSITDAEGPFANGKRLSDALSKLTRHADAGGVG